MSKYSKNYHYQCIRCFFTIDNDEQRMIQHCLKVHGSTGIFKKSYTTRIRKTIIKKEQEIIRL